MVRAQELDEVIKDALCQRNIGPLKDVAEHQTQPRCMMLPIISFGPYGDAL